MNVEIAAALNKQGIKLTPGQVSTIKTIHKKAHAAKKAAKKPAAVEAAPAPAVVEKPAKNGDTTTLEQVKKVAQTIKTIRGYQRVIEEMTALRPGPLGRRVAIASGLSDGLILPFPTTVGSRHLPAFAPRIRRKGQAAVTWQRFRC